MQVDVRTGLGILCDFVWFIYESSHIYSSKSFIAVERIHLKPSATRKTAVDKLKKLCVRRIIQISSTPACLQVVLHQKDSYKAFFWQHSLVMFLYNRGITPYKGHFIKQI